MRFTKVATFSAVSTSSSAGLPSSSGVEGTAAGAAAAGVGRSRSAGVDRSRSVGVWPETPLDSLCKSPGAEGARSPEGTGGASSNSGRHSKLVPVRRLGTMMLDRDCSPDLETVGRDWSELNCRSTAGGSPVRGVASVLKFGPATAFGCSLEAALRLPSRVTWTSCTVPCALRGDRNFVTGIVEAVLAAVAVALDPAG